MPRETYTQADWDRLHGLMANGSNATTALAELGIPRGSLGNLRRRFGGGAPGTVADEASGHGTIGELAQALNDHTEELLELAAQMCEATKHAHGLVLLDQTLAKLEAKQRETQGLRRRLGEVEAQLIARSSVVHSND